MNANKTFWMGSEHTVCEDYAIAHTTVGGISYAIVCDGCSASPNVDFGARILAMAAEQTLLSFLDTREFSFDASTFGSQTILKADQIFAVFPKLHPQALDATLLVTWVKEKKLTAYIYGDGVLVHRSKSGIKSIHIGLSSGAPDYLSYHLDMKRLNAYNNLKDNVKTIWTSYTGNFSMIPFEPFHYNADVEEGDVIAVISDGINSFRKADYTPIPWQDLVEEFTGFKNYEGEFVLRRISAFRRKCLKEGITHSDDISISAIVI